MDFFADLIGQNQAVNLLQQAVKLNRIAVAYLFVGTPGIGKSLAAVNFANLVFSGGIPESKHSLLKNKIQKRNHPDLLWVEPTYQERGELISASQALEIGLKRKAPPQIRIEQIRGITQFLARIPLQAPRLLVIIEDAQTMAESAANALLKTLEEPGTATLILLASNPDSLLPTLVSRCQRIPFTRLSLTNLQLVLQTQGYQEILEHSDLLNLAQGSPGQAIAAWNQWQAIPSELRQQLLQIPHHPLDALKLARQIDQQLDTQAQLWLIDYLQYYYWHRQPQPDLAQQWEKTRQYLLSYVQPRLVWENTLLQLVAYHQ